MIDRRTFVAGAAATLATGLQTASAQVQSKTPRIAYVSRAAPNWIFQAFLDGLAEFGYVNGSNIEIEEYWFSSFDELPDIAVRIRGTRPDAIVSLQTPTSLALKDAITDIPIIIHGVGDPIVRLEVVALGYHEKSRERLETQGFPREILLQPQIRKIPSCRTDLESAEEATGLRTDGRQQDDQREDDG